MIVKRKNAKGQIRYGARDGKKNWLGTFPTLREAREAEARAKVEVKSSGPTCGEFARRWLTQDCPRTSGRELKAITLGMYHTSLRKFIEEFEQVPLTSLSRDKAFDWAMAHRTDLPFVSTMFSHAHDLTLIDRNPFEKLGLQKGRGRKDKAPPTERELDALLEACGTLGAYAPTFRAFLIFQAYTALRPGETFALKWSDIEGDRIHVRRRRGRDGGVDLPKSNVERTVLLPPPAREALQAFPRGLDLVFRGIEGAQLTATTTNWYFRRVREAAGLEGFALYDLRHMAAHTLYVKMGLPARVVAVQLGHNDGGALVSELYGHGGLTALEELDEAWAAVGHKRGTQSPQPRSSAG